MRFAKIENILFQTLCLFFSLGSLPTYVYASETTTTTSGAVTFDFSAGNFANKPCMEVVSTGTEHYGATLVERTDDSNLIIDG